jgi:predicted dithiol-disulfide oxidoreductase (DUF899 family)
MSASPDIAIAPSAAARPMPYREGAAAIAEYRRQITDLRRRMREAREATAPEPVEDYVFATADGAPRLSELFGDQSDLIVIHNMGRSCSYCTLWADGFNGTYDRLANRAAFVVSSPDAPDAQRDFAAGRGWRFPMVSHQGSSFAADMGYRGEKGGLIPGVSVFRRDGDRILRVADTHFGPGDDFCAVWHFFDLLPAGADGWRARFSYE